MNNDLYKIFLRGFQTNSFIRIGNNKSLNLYIGKDENSKYTFEYRGKYVPSKLLGSDVILVSQGKCGDFYNLRFSLEKDELLEYFCTFCQDLFDSTENIMRENLAYKTLCLRYLSWKKLFKPHMGKLSDIEIVGLIGELLFLQDFMIPQYGAVNALDSWMGPEKTQKDFSINDTWYEIKTVKCGKDSIHISSLEQLDSESIGFLGVYCLEKMSPSFSGVKLNSLVMSILNKLPSVNREFFISKLTLYNYDFSQEYDQYVYSKVGFSQYEVNNQFPKLSRKDISVAITKVQYELNLSDIESFKINSINYGD